MRDWQARAPAASRWGTLGGHQQTLVQLPKYRVIGTKTTINLYKNLTPINHVRPRRKRSMQSRCRLWPVVRTTLRWDECTPAPVCKLRFTTTLLNIGLRY